jgi:hypothetical protein
MHTYLHITFLLVLCTFNKYIIECIITLTKKLVEKEACTCNDQDPVETHKFEFIHVTSHAKFSVRILVIQM